MSDEKSPRNSRQREKLIIAMLSYPTVEKAAEAAGISSTTAWRIKKTPQFKEEYRIARREAYSQSMARLQYASAAAVSVLLKVTVDPTVPVSLKVKAAAVALALSAK